MSSRLASVRLGPALLVATALVLGLGALAGAAPHTKPMISTKINGRLCQTVGGGRFVPIPGFQGERIDRRLLTDIHWISKHYPIYITDGYSLDAIHARNGEHPIGLALDIVPNRERGGTWADITRLAQMGRAGAGRAARAVSLGRLRRRCGARSRQPSPPLVEPQRDQARRSGGDRLHDPLSAADRRPDRAVAARGTAAIGRRSDGGRTGELRRRGRRTPRRSDGGPSRRWVGRPSRWPASRQPVGRGSGKPLRPLLGRRRGTPGRLLLGRARQARRDRAAGSRAARVQALTRRRLSPRTRAPGARGRPSTPPRSTGGSSMDR